MSDFSSNLVTKQAAAITSQSGGIRDGDDLSGLLLYATAIITLTTSNAAGDTFQLADLPAGAVVVPQLSHITGAAGGTYATLSIGDGAAASRYAVAVPLSSAGQKAFCGGSSLPATATAPYRLPDPTRLVGTLGLTSGSTAATTLAVTIAYRVKG